MQVSHSKIRRLQPHDLQKMWFLVLLDLSWKIQQIPLQILQLLWLSRHAVRRREGYLQIKVQTILILHSSASGHPCHPLRSYHLPASLHVLHDALQAIRVG